MNNLWEKAEQLAKRGYSTEFEGDVLSNGETVYLARNPELPGCKAQGATIDEAQANLAEVRVDYINMLLEEELPIPEPRQMIYWNTSMTGEKNSTTSITFSFDGTSDEDNMDAALDEVIQPDQRQLFYGIQLGGDLVDHR